MRQESRSNPPHGYFLEIKNLNYKLKLKYKRTVLKTIFDEAGETNKSFQIHVPIQKQQQLTLKK